MEQPAAAAAAPAAASQPVLPWMRVPLNIAAGTGVALSNVQGLHPALLRAVREQLGFVELFPVQAAVWRGLAGGHSTTHDMCICAPTGSGKTLAYALPMLNAILTGCEPSSCPVLKGLVVLPTRSLAVQVHSVLHSLGAAAGITVALAAAQEGVEAEAAKLVGALPGLTRPHVLVATPGRLMAHLQGSTGTAWAGSSICITGSSSSASVLSLQHLKFLVVDEADRLLRQDYHGWLPQVLEHLHAAARGSSMGSSLGSSLLPPQLLQPHGAPSSLVTGLGTLPAAHAQPGMLGSVCGGTSGAGSSMAAGGFTSSSGAGSQVLKLVVSATLTRDPSKLMRLELSCPRFIALTDVSRRYTLPPALQQYRLVVPAQHKPLALVGLLHRLGTGRTVVFASSLDMTHRLYLLLAAVPGLPCTTAEYSSLVSPEAQASALSSFKQGRVQVLVTSDAMARGMDVSGISCVINYDPPTYPKNYVHRAGRTARAGSTGSVYTLLKPEDVVHFNGMVRKMVGSKLQQVKLQPAELQELRPTLKAALQQVQELVQLEQQQERQAGPGRQHQQGQPSKRKQQQQSQQAQQEQQVLLQVDSLPSEQGVMPDVAAGDVSQADFLAGGKAAGGPAAAPQEGGKRKKKQQRGS